MNLLDILRQRGFVYNLTGNEKDNIDFGELLTDNKITAYIGFDPTSDSLHVGHLISLMALLHMKREGHNPIALIGGATGMIGDPSGKTETRTMQAVADLFHNVDKLSGQIRDFVGKDIQIVNNHTWFEHINHIFFLWEFGKYFSVNKMIKSGIYKSRLDSESNLTFLEFSYLCLQAYDFLHLHTTENCILQMGGADQWVNIAAGIELIHKHTGKQAYGLTFPLILTAEGKKMGKTEAGAIWLDKSKTSPFDYYQYWINCHDEDIIKFIKLFTFISMEEIEQIVELNDSIKNKLKTVLAYETTYLLHGEKEANKALSLSSKFFGKRIIDVDLLPSAQIHSAKEELNDSTILLHEREFNTVECVIDFLLSAGIFKSKTQVKRRIKEKSLSINEFLVEDLYEEMKIEVGDEYVIKVGKKKIYHVKLI